jgi:hypothetical protein
MVWFLHGTEATIVTNDGRHRLWGRSRQDVRLATDSGSAAVARIQGLEAGWSIFPADASDFIIDPNGEGLLKRVKGKPEATHFMISCLPEIDRGSVHVFVCMPPAVFDAHLPFWRDYLFRSSSVTYSIRLNYSGFRLPHAKTDNITADEWIAEDDARRKSVLGEGVANFVFQEGCAAIDKLTPSDRC